MTKARELAKLGEVMTNSQIGGRRNLVLNPKFSIAQRGTSFSGFSTSEYHLDRFKNGMGDTTARFTVTQASSGLNGFPHCLKYDCTTAESSLNNGNARMFLHTRFEGQDLQQLKKGTSDAEKVTVSFYVKSNKTGTYTIEIADEDNGRRIGKTYTINSSGVWEYKVIVFDADTTGAFDNDNNNSCHLVWHLIAGANFKSGTFSTSWATQTDANRVSSSQVNIGDSTDNTWEITGVSMEVGDFPNGTPFEHRSVGEELALCKRYYQSREGKQGNWGSSIAYSTSAAQQWLTFPEMRTAPTVTFTGTLRLENGDSTFNTSSTSFNGSSTTTQSISYWIGNFSGLIDNDPYYVYATPTTSQMKFDSEL